MAQDKNQEQQQGSQPMAQTKPQQQQMARPNAASSPYSLLGRLMNDMDRMFGAGTAEWIPKVDITQREGQLVVHADLPGLGQDDVVVNVDNGVLTISGERTRAHEHESGGVYRCERSYGIFERSIALPDGVDPETVQATFDNGVLEVTMPMPEQQQTRKGRSIPIRTSPDVAGREALKH